MSRPTRIIEHTRTPEDDERGPSRVRDLLTPDELALQHHQNRDAARREQAQHIGLRLLTRAIEDPDAFLAAMRDAGMFAPDEEAAPSFQVARAQLVDEWVNRDARELAEHLEVAGDPDAALAFWLEEGAPSGAWAWLYGPYGCGKTWQAAQVIRAIHQRAGESVLPELRPEMWRPDRLRATAATTVRYVVEADMLDSLRPSAFSPRTVEHWASAPWLIVDETCAGQITEWGEEHLFAIYDRRYRARRPTLFLSNWHPSDTDKPGAWNSGRLASRLLHRLGGESLPWAVAMRGDWRR